MFYLLSPRRRRNNTQKIPEIRVLEQEQNTTHDSTLCALVQHDATVSKIKLTKLQGRRLTTLPCRRDYSDDSATRKSNLHDERRSPALRRCQPSVLRPPKWCLYGSRAHTSCVCVCARGRTRTRTRTNTPRNELLVKLQSKSNVV